MRCFVYIELRAIITIRPGEIRAWHELTQVPSIRRAVTMASAVDVARYILQKTGPISAMKLQKLVYYSQAWALVWDDEPIFDEEIEAWANGPVVRELYEAHRGVFTVTESIFGAGNPSLIKDKHRETIDVVIKELGKKSAQWLSDQTHSENPWRDARMGLNDSDRGSQKISLESMAEYYGSL